MNSLSATASEQFCFLGKAFSFGSLCLDSSLLLLHLVAGVSVELVDLSVHHVDVRRELLSVVLKFFQADLQGSPLIVALENFLLCLRNSNLADFVLLLQIDYQFVLSLDHGLVLLDHLLRLLALSVVLRTHVCPHVVESIEFLVKTRDFVVFNYHQLVKLVDFLLRVSSLSFVALQH